MDAIAVDLARPQIRQITVPYLMRFFRQSDAARFCLRLRRIKKTELDLCRVFGEERKIHTAPSNVAPNGEGEPGQTRKRGTGFSGRKSCARGIHRLHKAQSIPLTITL